MESWVMFPSWWRKLAKWAGSNVEHGRRRHLKSTKPRFTSRLALEQLEDRLVLTTPTVLSINRSLPLGPITNASSVSYAVTFNEPVTGVDLTDFQLVETGTVAATLNQVTPTSGVVYTVTISGITGIG